MQNQAMAHSNCWKGDEVIGIDNVNDYYDVNLKLARLDRVKPFDGFAEVRGKSEDRELTDVPRYFMTIPEASQLVLQASAIAKGGEVFVLDMGEPIRIEELATTMVRLYGRKLQRDTGNPSDIEIVVEGSRPSEKMYEEIFVTNSHRQTEADKILAADEDWLDDHQLALALAVIP